VFHKILSFEVNLAPEGNAARTGSGSSGLLTANQLLGGPLRDNCRLPASMGAGPPSDRSAVLFRHSRIAWLEHCNVDDAVRPGDPYRADEIPNRRRRHPATPQRR